MKTVWVIGSGGHAKVVIDTLRAAGFDIGGLLDDDPGRLRRDVLGAPVLGDTSPAAVARLGVTRAVIAIGANRARAGVAQRLEGRLTWETVVHPRAYMAGGVRIGEGSVAFAGAVEQPGAAVGRHVILNTACSADHDNEIGDFAQLAPGAHLAGTVRVGEGAFIGTGATVLPGLVVGAWSTVGGGGVVARDVPPGVTVKGVPARGETTPADKPGVPWLRIPRHRVH